MNKNEYGIKKYINKAFLFNTCLIAGVVIAMLLFCGYAEVFRALQDKRFAPGVSIDGIDVSGMTYDEARQVVSDHIKEVLSAVRVTLAHSGETTALHAENLGVTIDDQHVFDEAYLYNKRKEDTVERMYDKTVERSGDKCFHTEVQIDENRLRATLAQYAAQYDVQPIDAAASFDKATETFTYTDERPGLRIDTDALADKILDMLNKKEYSALQVQSETVAPGITREELERNTELVGSFSTVAEDNKNRNTNIRLMCEAVNGLEIKPGEVLSINGLVGRRTKEKGFKNAPAISDGMLVDEVGGGICQLAGTLYNAALLADLEIMERVSHTWPSSYLPIGQDATLNWNDKDLKIKNNSDYSIFFSAELKNHKVNVKIYGQPLEDGITIKIKNEIREEIEPKDTEIRYTNQLPSGARQTVRRPRKGYLVDVYRIYLKNNIKIDKQFISADYYPPLSKVVLIGSKKQDK